MVIAQSLPLNGRSAQFSAVPHQSKAAYAFRVQTLRYLAPTLTDNTSVYIDDSVATLRMRHLGRSVIAGGFLSTKFREGFSAGRLGAYDDTISTISSSSFSCISLPRVKLVIRPTLPKDTLSLPAPFLLLPCVKKCPIFAFAVLPTSDTLHVSETRYALLW
ncbi:unnamed protein product [Peniophora sp. CBMAI 1063]|nr:unnamed protein product [Peniophora sp. CBMAI 1063]